MVGDYENLRARRECVIMLKAECDRIRSAEAKKYRALTSEQWDLEDKMDVMDNEQAQWQNYMDTR